MKTMLLAAAAVLCLGAGAAYADEGDDGGIIPNTYFNELPGVIATAPGMPPNNVSANAYQTMPQSSAATVVMPSANSRTTTNGG